MRYQKTQVYLDPEVHRRLLAEAQERGISLAELLRELTARHVAEATAPYGAKSFDSIIGLFASDGPADAVADEDQVMGDVADYIYAKKMSLLLAEESKSGRRRAAKRPRKTS